LHITFRDFEIKITIEYFAQKFELKWSLGGPLSKLCVAPPFSINFRCKIENQVSVRHTRLTRGPHEPVSANWLFIQFVFNPVDILFENINKWNKTLKARTFDLVPFGTSYLLKIICRLDWTQTEWIISWPI
jgi:hypothetical protein